MKPAPFDYFTPDSTEEVVALLAQHGDEAKLLAGGQSLMPLLALRLATPETIVDLNRVSALDYIDDRGDVLAIGALARQRAVEKLDGIAGRCPMLADAVRLVGHVPIRNRGTVVGSLTHADPAAEWPALALALDAEIDVVGPNGQRTMPASSFFFMYLTTALEPDEVATEVRVHLPQGRVGSSFLELARRHGDFAVVGAGAVVTLSDTSTIDSARVVLIGVGGTPIRVAEAEHVLVGAEPGAEAFDEAAQAVRGGIEPTGDIHGSAEYRRTIAAALTRRALTRAVDRAGRGEYVA